MYAEIVTCVPCTHGVVVWSPTICFGRTLQEAHVLLHMSTEIWAANRLLKKRNIWSPENGQKQPKIIKISHLKMATTADNNIGLRENPAT